MRIMFLLLLLLLDRLGMQILRCAFQGLCRATLRLGSRKLSAHSLRFGGTLGLG